MSLNTSRNQVIALAGISQAVYEVKQIATTGSANAEALEANIGSILKLQSDNVEDIYGGLTGIKIGLEQLQKQLTGMAVADPEQARYAAALIYLEKQLSKNQNMLIVIRESVEIAQAQAEQFGLTHENVLARLGDLYHSTVSTIKPRIMVNGDQTYLANTTNINKIRSLLLSGIRATLLWRQCGGTRWKFLLHRKRLQDQVQVLLDEIN
jgi:high frequency lysogenization protein